MKYLSAIDLLRELVGRRRDDTEVCPSATNSPEQVRIRALRYLDLLSLGCDEVDRDQSVNHEAKGALQISYSSAEGGPSESSGIASARA